jgi:hypothetical protein
LEDWLGGEKFVPHNFPLFFLGILAGTIFVARFWYQVGKLLQLHVVNFAFYRDMASSLNVLSTKISI